MRITLACLSCMTDSFSGTLAIGTLIDTRLWIGTCLSGSCTRSTSCRCLRLSRSGCLPVTVTPTPSSSPAGLAAAGGPTGRPSPRGLVSVSLPLCPCLTALYLSPCLSLCSSASLSVPFWVSLSCSVSASVSPSLSQALSGPVCLRLSLSLCIY